MIEKIAAFQHSRFPLPPALFGLLFSNRYFAKIFRRYGHACAMSDYRTRTDNTSYWFSYQSVYWHLARSRDLDKVLLRNLPEWPEACSILGEAKIICEPGFGIGKMTLAMIRAGLLRPERIVGFEPVAAVRAAAQRRWRNLPLVVRDGDLASALREKFDTFLCQGGTLMFFPPSEIAAAFKNLPAECRRIVVVNEGAPVETARADETWMHGLPSLVKQAGFRTTFEEIEDRGHYRLFIACR